MFSVYNLSKYFNFRFIIFLYGMFVINFLSNNYGVFFDHQCTEQETL